MVTRQNKSFGQVQLVEIDAELAGQRIDNFLLARLKGVPKSRIYRLIRRGEIRVNKGRRKPDYHLQQSDLVRIPPIRMAVDKLPPKPGENIKRYLEQAVIFEDDDLLIVNKPSGLAVHGGSGIRLGLIETLRAIRPGERHLELVHRLDRDTSGCLMVARTRFSLANLQEAMRKNSIEKTYQCLVVGRWEKGCERISAPLKKNELCSGERIVKIDVEGKMAVSHFRIQRRFERATLMEVKLETGRTHQIRVHCQLAGHPVAGDEKYGDAEVNRYLKRLGLQRLFLHAGKLVFQHPVTGAPIRVVAPMPEELQAVVDKL